MITYDPRGLGRSTHKDGRVDNTPTLQADDVHAVIEALGAGPAEMFASSGGAVTALALVAAAIAEFLGPQPTVFPSHHGGFVGGESGYAGQPEAFARRLRDILDDGT